MMPDPQNELYKIRARVLDLSNQAQSAHAGSALSCVEILYCLFKEKSLHNSTLEKIILSKGHAAMALYSVAENFDLVQSEKLENYLKNNTDLWGHPSKSNRNNFIDWSTGSLGHGLPVATGFAYSRKIIQKNESRVAVVLSDGECNEGTTWESALFAAHHKLSNLTAIIDYNKIQSFGRCEDVLGLEPFVDKWLSLNWCTTEVDGHNIEQINHALSKDHNKPHCIIAHTVKGKGVLEIEDTIASHYKPITKKQLEDFQNEK